MRPTVDLDLRSVTPVADGASLGPSGPWALLRGVARVTVDPHDPANAGVPDVAHAARNADGLVEAEVDWGVVRPVDLDAPAGPLLVAVPNRGFASVLLAVLGTDVEPPLVPRPSPGPTDFLLQRGWRIAWCGWQWDVPRSPLTAGIHVPPVVRDGVPIAGPVRFEIQPEQPVPDWRLAYSMGLGAVQLRYAGYPAEQGADQDATLTVRDLPAGPRTVIPRDQWAFARDEHGAPVADDEHLWLAGGFEPGRIYEFVYRTRACPFVGAGLLALRDVAAFLRHGAAADGNPLAGAVSHSIGFGVSQTGRVLREMLHAGLVHDPAGRPVFDGMLVTLAGASRGEFNQRYGQPGVIGVPALGDQPPFATGALLDRVARQWPDATLPKVIVTNTASEYWAGDGALAHLDPRREHDLSHPLVREYLTASVDHVGLAAVSDWPANPIARVDGSPVLRAALVNLDRWVVDGEEPPPSRVPRLADGTAVDRLAALERFRAIPGAHVPDPDGLPQVRDLDLGPEATAHVVRFPIEFGPGLPAFVAALDDDGNDRVGVRLPAVAVPLATFTGFNPRRPFPGRPSVLARLWGSRFAFALNPAERTATGDDRPSVAERYRDRDDYLDRARAVALDLVADRLVLGEELETLVAHAAVIWDELVGTPAP